MTIENQLTMISVDLKRIADALEKVGGEVVSKTKPKKVKKTKPVEKEKVIVVDAASEEKVSVDDLDGEVSTLTADDVKAEAKKLVDHTPNSRKGYEKAENIIKELGAASLKAIVPEKYEIAISLFRKAITEWK